MLKDNPTLGDIPEETYRVAHAIYPKGNVIMQIRDELEGVFTDEMFADLYPDQGCPALSPQRLVLSLILQYVAGYSDRQTTEAIRDHISWKYALGLDLEDRGFDHSVLSEFRDRVLAGQALNRIFDTILGQLSEKGLLKGSKRQRTDATHILASVRNLNRIELVGETMRISLNKLAQVAPDWLSTIITQDWIDRYSQGFNDWHLPKQEKQREELVQQIGVDGYRLLGIIYEHPCPPEVRELVEVERMRQIWVQQFWCDDGEVRLRETKDTPQGENLIQSPFDMEARFTMEHRGKKWLGYKTHFTETCAVDAPRIITHVMTCPATTNDKQLLAPIQAALCEKNLKPQEHYLDAGYSSSRNLVSSQAQQIDLMAPVAAVSSWQAQQDDAFDTLNFRIDWQTQQVTCPVGNTSRTWSASHNQAGDPLIHIRFARKDCQACRVRERCTKGQARSLKIYAQPFHEALVAARERQKTADFKEKYNIRAGIEGTFSVAVRNSNLRQTPFVGLEKTHLHCLFSAIALNLKRAINWLNDVPIATTRKSPLKQFALAA